MRGFREPKDALEGVRERCSPMPELVLARLGGSGGVFSSTFVLRIIEGLFRFEYGHTDRALALLTGGVPTRVPDIGSRSASGERGVCGGEADEPRG